MPLPKVFDLDKFMELWLTPRSDKEIAEHFEVQPETIRRWRHRYREELQGKMQEYALAENLRLTPLAMKKMGELIKNGNVEVLKMHFKLLGVAEQLEHKGGDTQIQVIIPAGVQVPAEPKTFDITETIDVSTDLSEAPGDGS